MRTVIHNTLPIQVSYSLTYRKPCRKERKWIVPAASSGHLSGLFKQDKLLKSEAQLGFLLYTLSVIGFMFNALKP